MMTVTECMALVIVVGDDGDDGLDGGVDSDGDIMYKNTQKLNSK